MERVSPGDKPGLIGSGAKRGYLKEEAACFLNHHFIEKDDCDVRPPFLLDDLGRIENRVVYRAWSDRVVYRT